MGLGFRVPMVPEGPQSLQGTFWAFMSLGGGPTWKVRGFKYVG